MSATALTGSQGQETQAEAATEGAAPMTDSPKSASLHALLELCARYMPPADLDLVRRAYEIAAEAHQGVTRKSGEPYIEHPLAVARILAELAMDAPGIVAALLHDTVEDTDLTVEDVATHFGPTVATIVDGVTKFSVVEASAEPEIMATSVSLPSTERKRQQQSETMRKLFLAMGADPRVVLLKLADRLHNLRTLDAMSPAQIERTARETQDIFAPLAGRLGLYLMKTEMEDLAFLYLDPRMFEQVSRRLEDERMKREDWARRMRSRLCHELEAQGISAAVNWRFKHPYRAYREAADSGMDIAGLHDLIAFRVLVTDNTDCYRALRVIHHLWHPHADRIRDYIATPKINGYQSFHTAVFALDGRLAQIHIRTHRMHRAAQHGVAAYWLERAARGEPISGDTTIRVAEALSWVTQLASWQRELDLSAADFVATVRGDLFDEQIYVFTPKGEIRELPQGSTVLDLAYQIHTEIGNHTSGATVQTTTSNGVLVSRTVPVNYVLRRGDIVLVATLPDAQPRIEWLDIARTRYARDKIGRALRRTHEPGGDRTRHVTERPNAQTLVEPLLHPSGALAKVELARCCFPCPGDTIVALAGPSPRLTVHRVGCGTLARTVARRRDLDAAYPEPQEVIWPQIQPITYRVHLLIGGQDHKGLMYEISVAAASLGINVSGSRARANRARHRAIIELTLDVPATTRLDLVLRRLHTVPGVLDVERDLTKGCNRHS
jgi:RelA/SpoT family (p)ppGpp synthetase